MTLAGPTGRLRPDLSAPDRVPPTAGRHRTGRPLPRWGRLALHGLVILGLFAVSVALATWYGALWPLDIGFSSLITLVGFGVLSLAWGPAWLGLVIASASLRTILGRLILWPIATSAMIALHAVFGADRGLMALDRLGSARAVHLYAVPVALALVVGSTVRDAFRKHQTPMPPTTAAANSPATASS